MHLGTIAFERLGPYPVRRLDEVRVDVERMTAIIGTRLAAG